MVDVPAAIAAARGDRAAERILQVAADGGRKAWDAWCHLRSGEGKLRWQRD